VAKKGLFFRLFLFSCGAGDLTQGLVHAKKSSTVFHQRVKPLKVQRWDNLAIKTAWQ
jgi:hypothetical protein